MPRDGYVLIILIAIIIGFFLYRLYWQYQKFNHDKIRIKTKKRRDYLFYVSRVLRKAPVVKKFYGKFYARLAMLYPSDPRDIDHLATVMLLQSTALTIVCLVGLLMFSGGDAFYILLSLLTVYIIYTGSVTKKLKNLEKTLLSQFADFITTCRGNYHTVGMVDEAIYMCLDELPHEVSLHVHKIYELIIDVNLTDKVEEYTDIAPNRFFKLFTSVCATVQEYGDKKLENGASLFLSNLEYIKQELYIEINKIKRDEERFAGLSVISLAPVFTLKLIQKVISGISNLQSFYQGPGGFAAMIIIFLATFVCHEMIGILKEGTVSKQQEHKILEKLAKLPIVGNILTKVINRWYTRALRINDNLLMAGDHISAQAYLLKRFLIGAVAGIAVIIISIISLHINSQNILHDFSDTFTSSIIEDEEYREQVRNAGEAYLNAHKGFASIESEEMAEEISEESGLRKDIALEVAETVIERQQEYRDNYFRWYNIIIALIAFAIGFNIPVWYLKYQVTIMRWNMEDEVSQFRSLALILMNVDGMTLDVILEWMEKFAVCFKESISECIINLDSSPERALSKMRNNETFPPFIRFCDNLLNIDEVGVASAFDEVVTEQENYKEQRKLNNEIVGTRRANWGKLICWIPLLATAGGYIIFPLYVMGSKMWDTMQTIQNGAGIF